MKNHIAFVVLLLGVVSTSVGATFTEGFDYPEGAILAGQGPWQGSSSHGSVRASGGQVVLSGDTTIDHTYVSGLGIDGGSSGVVTFMAEVHRRTDLGYTGQNLWWHFELWDDQGYSLGGWGGRDNSIFSYGSGFPGGTGHHNALTGGIDVIRAEIDFSAGTIDFSFNGDESDSRTFSVHGNTLDKIGFVDDLDPTVGQEIGFDNIQIVPEPATMSLLGLGAIALIRRKK